MDCNNILLFRLVVLPLAINNHAEAGIIGLRPGGLHVCARTVTYNTYYVQTLTRKGYDNYQSCCKRKWRVCTSRCTKYRSKTVRYTKAQLRVNSRIEYFCCAGWAPKGNACPLPVCNPACRFGNCVNPNQCQCHKGWEGRLCEKDIDECKISQPCEQFCQNLPGTYACSCRKGFVKGVANNAQDKTCLDVDECARFKPCRCASTLGGCTATCENNPGSFLCSCRYGFTLAFDQQTCVDINECMLPKVSKCEHQCLNRPGSFICSCNSGFRLAVDKRSCDDINECSNLNGGCNQICSNRPGAFSCSCLPGYRLQSNQRTCIDIDECKERDPCDQNCRNYPGNFKCSCKTGFALQPDEKTCKDIDECASKSTNGCTHKCSNTFGSYTCSCNPGFKLNANNRSCDDIDECTLNTHKCQHNCLNTVGSYKCSCKPGYLTHADGKTCIAKSCRLLTQPLNGKMTCTGSVTDSSCKFSCNDGYELEGSQERICQPNALWSGVAPSCKERSCPELLPPKHGSVMLWCTDKLGSQCSAKCNKGYRLNGTDYSKCIIQDGVMRWSPNNATCAASTPCLPNPCKHDGQCKELFQNEVTCQCRETEYKGNFCQTGLISLPIFPKLNVNEESDPLTIKASPKNVLIIKPVYNKANLKFTPEEFMIYPTTKSFSFTIKSLNVGVFPVNFELIGVDAVTFEKPEQASIYSYKKVDKKLVDIGMGFSNRNCKEETLKKCSGSLKLKSSCTWNVNNNGFVSINNGKVNLPVSLVGLSQSDLQMFNSKGSLVPTERLKTFLSKRILPYVCDTSQNCAGSVVDANVITTITENNLFQREYFNAISKILPSWLLIRVDMKENYFAAENFYSMLQEAKDTKLSFCGSVPNKPNAFISSYFPASKIKLNFLTSSKSTSRADQPVCIGVDLCNNVASFTFHESDYLNFDSDLLQNSLDNIKLKVKGFSVGGEYTKCMGNDCFDFNSAWNTSTSISFISKQSSVNFAGLIYIKLTEDIALEKFTKNVNFLGTGYIDFKVSLNIFGAAQTFLGRSTESKILARIGGNEPYPACKNKGFTIHLQPKSIKIDRITPQLSLKLEKDLNIYFPHDIQGGKIAGVNTDVLNRILLQLRAINRVLSLKLKLIKDELTKTKQNKEQFIIEKYGKTFMTLLQTLEKSLHKGIHTDFMAVFTGLDRLKEAGNDLKVHIDGICRRYKGNPSLYASAKTIQAQIKLLERLNLINNNQILTQKDDGKVISFYGKVCFHNLCIGESHIKIYDISSNAKKHCETRFSKYVNEDSVVVSVNPTKDLVLSTRIRLEQGQELLFTVSKTKNKISSIFQSKIRLESNFQSAVITITEKEVSISAPNIKVVNNEGFTVRTKVDLSTASWESLLYKIQGESSAFASKLLRTTQILYQNISTLTKRRLQSSKDRKDITYQNLFAEKERLAKAIEAVKESKKDLLLTETLYRTHKTQQETNQSTFNSYLKTIDPLFIKKNVESVCTFQTCKETCLPLPVCEIRQDPLTLEYISLDCVQKHEIIRRQATKQFDTLCDVKQYLFIPYYTGSCKPNPGEEVLSEQKFKKSLEDIGESTGRLIGQYFGNPELGGAIGKFVGKIAGWFSSCDRSMETFTKSWYEQKKCTLLTTGVEEIKRTTSRCSEKMSKVKTGFQAPRKVCKINECLAKVQDQICLLNNQRCEQKRERFFNDTATIPKIFTDLYRNIAICNENVEASAVKVQLAKRVHEFNRREVERIKNQVYSLEEEKKISDQKYSVVSTLLKEKICVMNNFYKEKDLSRMLKINDVNFVSTLPFTDNILLKLDVTYKSKKLTVPFLYNIQNDKENKGLSINALGGKVLNSVLCKSNRERRSIENKEPDLTFEPWFVDEKLNASTAKLACVTLEKTIEFLKSTIKTLNTKTDSANQLKLQLQYSAGKIGQALSNTFSVSTNGYADGNEIVKANQRLLMSANNQLNAINMQITPTTVLDTWNNEAEIITGFKDVKICLNYRDCVDKALDTLLELPTISSVPRQNFEAKIFSLRDKLILLSRQTSLVDLLSKSAEIEKSIDAIKGLCLHCADPPVVSLTQEEDEDIEEDSFITLRCDARSKLPVKYYWTLNEKILDYENTATLTIKITNRTSGVYTCIAETLVGQGTSSGKNIVAYIKPKFISEPKDVIFVLPSDKESLISLECNVTALPKANISWVYSDASTVKTLVGESAPILQIKSPREDDAGYYHCIAENRFGKVESNPAKVDVLNAVLSASRFSLSFNIELVIGIYASSFNQIIKVVEKELTDFENKIDVYIQYLDNAVKVTIDASASISPNTYMALDAPTMLRKASKLRQAMASASAAIANIIIENNETVHIENGRRVLHVDMYSFDLDMQADICEIGYKIHENGYLCVKCPKGSAGKGCQKCPLNTYSDKTGMIECIPCGPDEFTEKAGSISKKSCLKKQARPTDVIILIDTSSSYLNSPSDFDLVKDYVKKVVNTYKDSKSFRFALITYYKYVNVFNDLANYLDVFQYLLFLEMIDEGTITKDTSLALKEANEMFETQSDKQTKKVVVVITNGFSKTDFSASHQGFSATRKAASALQQKGVHVVCVGHGKHIDIDEMRAIASYPKLKNVYLLESGQSAINNLLVSINNFVGGACVASAINIGILVQPRTKDAVQLAKDKKAVTDLIISIHRVFPNEHFMLIPDKESDTSDGFYKYQEKQLRDIISNYYSMQSSKFDVVKRIKQAEHIDLTEKHRSWGNIKALMIVTENPIAEDLLKGFQKSIYDEDITIVNFVMNKDGINEQDGLILNFDKYQKFIENIKKRSGTKLNC